MSIGVAAAVAVAAVAICSWGDSVSILVVSIGLAVAAAAVTVGFAGVCGVVTDGQIALHVILGRGVGTVGFAEQTVVRVLAGCAAAWGFSCEVARGAKRKEALLVKLSALGTNDFPITLIMRFGTMKMMKLL